MIQDSKLTKDEGARVARLVELDLRTTTGKLDVNDVQRVLEHYARQSGDQLFKRASYASDAAVKRMLRQVNIIRQERLDELAVLAPVDVVAAARAELVVEQQDGRTFVRPATPAPADPTFAYESARAVNLVGHADFIREEASATKPAGMSLRAALKTTVRDRVERGILSESEADDVWNILLWQDAYLSPTRDGGFTVDREADEAAHQWIERSRRVRLGSDLIELTRPSFTADYLADATAALGDGDELEPELPPFCEACDDAGERSDHDEPAYADSRAAHHGIAARIERTGYPVVGSVAEDLLRRELARLAVQGGGSDVDQQQVAIARDLRAVRRASVGSFGR